MRSPRIWSLAALCLFVAACGPSDAETARGRLNSDHVPRVRQLVDEDLSKHRAGLAEAASRLAPGFAIEDAAQKEKELRAAMRALERPPRGVGAFFASPMTFLAALDSTGRVIARDADPDPMRGQDWAGFPVVAAALKGQAGEAVVDLPSTGEEAPVVWLFVAPVEREGATVGAVALGIPLWSLGQRMLKQMKVEDHAEFQAGAVVWTYFYRGDRLLHRGTPPDLDVAVPDAAARRAGLKEHPEGFDGELNIFGREYGYAVAPIPALGEDTGVVILRGEP